jgi:hypothetical protein
VTIGSLIQVAAVTVVVLLWLGICMLVLVVGSVVLVARRRNLLLSLLIRFRHSSQLILSLSCLA